MKKISISLKQFVAISGFFAFIVFISLYFYYQAKLNQTNQLIELRTTENAYNELLSIIEKLDEDASKVAKELSTWQEVSQQLSNKVIYPYWKSLRLMQSNRMPKYALDVEIYDNKGLAIQKLASFSVFPEMLYETKSKLIINRLGKYFLIVSQPIFQQFEDSPKKIGYLLIQFELLPYLLSVETLKYIDAKSITLDPKLTEAKLTDIHQFIRYKNINNDDILSFKALFSDSLINLSLISAFLIIALFIFIIKLIGQPLTFLNGYISDLEESNKTSKGKNNQPIFSFLEIDKIHQSIAQYHNALVSSKSKLYNKNIELWNMAHVDPLTSANNRRAFDEKLENIQKTLSRSSINISLLLIDVNDFKSINDTYGHQTGDDVLVSIVNTFKKVLRTGEDIYRIGGDEFAIILIDTDAQSAMALARRCLKMYGEFDFAKLKLSDKVRLSIGIADTIKSNQDNNINDLLWKADLAMYAAKKPNSGYIVIYHEKLNAENKVYVSWINQAIYLAIETGENIEMDYQPIVDIKSNKPAYCESLLRINYENKKIFPDSIFPFIGSKSLEIELDRSIILKVAEDMSNGIIPDNIGVSVNLSAQIITKNELITWLKPLEVHLASRAIILEITETSLVASVDIAKENLAQLQNMGYKISLDDFGSGYSSFSYLSNMPIDIVKFDISLITSFTNNPSENHIVAKLAQMISDSGYEIVAEGIESHAQLDIIKQYPFDKMQGFLLDLSIRQCQKH